MDAVRTAIEVHGLSKRFGTVTALESVDFSVRKGELFGLLGPNGAGKTTTINILTGLSRADAGTIRIGGIDCSARPKAAQHRVGIVPDESNLYPELSGFENLCFCAALYGIRKSQRQARARELLEEFDLAHAAQRLFAAYSKGMKRRLTIAAGIIHDPSILFLDEPTTGVDVASARQIRQLLAARRRAGTTILLTTHYIEEAERLCDRIAFIVQGRIVRTGTVGELLEPVRSRHLMWLALAGEHAGVASLLAAQFPDLDFEDVEGGRIRVESGTPIRVAPLVRFLEERGIDVIEARRHRPSLEDVFVRITGIQAAALRREKERRGGGGP